MFHKRGKKNRGFTLIEVLIAVVIVGILASLAIVRYTDTVDRCRVGEAKGVLLSAYAGYKRLMMDGETVSSGNPISWTRVGMSDPNNMGNRKFSYSFQPNTASPTSVRAVLLSDSSKTVSVSLSNGAVTKSGF